MGAYNVQNDARIPNLASEFKSTSDSLLVKTLSKLVKIGYLANFRGGQMLPDLNSEARFEIK